MLHVASLIQVVHIQLKPGICFNKSLSGLCFQKSLYNQNDCCRLFLLLLPLCCPTSAVAAGMRVCARHIYTQPLKRKPEVDQLLKSVWSFWDRSAVVTTCIPGNKAVSRQAEQACSVIHVLITGITQFQTGCGSLATKFAWVLMQFPSAQCIHCIEVITAMVFECASLCCR